MSMRQQAYRRMLIKVDSFRLVGTHSFISSLTIVETTGFERVVVEIPVTHLLFDCEDRALEETLADGRLLVDGLGKATKPQ